MIEITDFQSFTDAGQTNIHKSSTRR